MKSFLLKKGQKMIPFLKHKKEAAMSGPDEVLERKPDEDKEFDLLDAVVSDMMEAFEKKDKGLLKYALEALMEHMEEVDEIQDEELLEEK